MTRLFRKKLRYAVVGLGDISQRAALPAFANVRNSELAALVSGDPQKLKALGKKYGIKRLYNYEQFEQCLLEGGIDAVYIATPNSEHTRFALMAARAKVHILCEKPLAMDSLQCEDMIQAAKANRVKLMTAYRLHLEKANLKAIELIQAGKIGEPLFFTSEFGFPVRGENYRLDPKKGGGPIYDIGIYCINAARYIFQAEPREVFACSSQITGKARFKEIGETVVVTMRFPRQRLATFICSFASAPVDTFRVIGTQGDLLVKDAYEWSVGKEIHLTIQGRAKSMRFEKSGQFEAEFDYFSECILKNRTPEPSGLEGLADIRVIEAIQRSLEEGSPVTVVPVTKKARPTPAQVRELPAHEEPEEIGAAPPKDEAA